MIPPISSTLLSQNQNLQNLYVHLTNHVLARDSSTVARNSEYRDTRRELEKISLERVRDEILICALEEVAGKNGESDGLVKQMREAVENVASYIGIYADGFRDIGEDDEDVGVGADVNALMRSEIDLFEAHLPEVLGAVSRHTMSTIKRIEQVARDLAVDLSSLTGERGDAGKQNTGTLHDDEKVDLGLALATTLETHEALSQQHTDHIVFKIRALELVTNSVQARHTAARSGYLAAVAKAMTLKAEVVKFEAERDIYGNVELVETLKKEVDGLKRQEIELERQERDIEDVLNEYDTAGGEVMFATIGQRYKEVEDEIEVMKRDIERLEG